MTGGAHRRGGRMAVAGGVALALAAACSDVPTDPTEPFSMSVSLPFPAVVAGEAMTDEAGQPAPVQVTVYNGQGEIIPDAAVVFRLLDEDTGITIDESGLITAAAPPADGELPSDVRVVVDAGGLQSAPLAFDVVPRPDSLHLPQTETDTLRWSNLPNSDANRSDTLTAYVWHLPAADADSVPVPSWVVRYAFSVGGAPATSDSTDQLWLSDDGGTRHTSVDTTDASGRVLRRLRVIGGLAGVEYVDVVVTVLGRGTLLAKPDTIRIPLRAP